MASITPIFVQTSEHLKFQPPKAKAAIVLEILIITLIALALIWGVVEANIYIGQYTLVPWQIFLVFMLNFGCFGSIAAMWATSVGSAATPSVPQK
jgi:hypothetical protein